MGVVAPVGPATAVSAQIFFSPTSPPWPLKVAGVVNRVNNKRGDNFFDLSGETVAHSSDALVCYQQLTKKTQVTQPAQNPSRNSNHIPDILRPNKLHMCVHKLMSAPTTRLGRKWLRR